MFPPETKILIVDDAMSMRMFIRKALKDLGFTNLAEARHGNDAIRQLETAHAEGNPFELLLSDVNMPMVSGIELLRHVRENADLKDLPVIFITAEAEKDQLQEADGLGVNGCVGKPCPKEKIQPVLESVYKDLQDQKKAA